MTELCIFDGHCDTAVELWRRSLSLADSPLAVSLEKARGFRSYVQVFAFCVAWMPPELRNSGTFARSLAYFSGQLDSCRDEIHLLRTARELEAVLSGGGRGAMLSIEGAEAIACDPGRLEEAYEAGVRMISLTWNHSNALAGSCQTGEGLTGQGREFFRRAQRLGMLVDVSHVSDRAFWELCELAERPIVASHSNARALCSHPRNLTDDQFRALCDLGGTAGINLFRAFLSDGPATVEDVCRHIDRFCDLGGPDHVALGGDLDGCDELPAGIDSVADYGKIAAALEARGYGEDALQEIFSGALLRTVSRCFR